MLIIECQEYLDKVRAQATAMGKLASLETMLDRLDHLADGADRRCVVYKDFAPLSFGFEIQRKQHDGKYACSMVGGLIYHGRTDGFGDGSGPAFAVTLEPCDGWSIHT